MITNREAEIRAYVEAYNNSVGDASLEYLRLALDLLDEAHPTHWYPALTTPPEAGVMERARKLLDDNPDELDDEEWLACALIEYGDQRAREARAAAIEEAAKVLDRDWAEASSGDGVNRRLWCERMAYSIRALADTRPQSEGGEK